MWTFNGKAATICLVVLAVSSVSAHGNNNTCSCLNGTAATGCPMSGDINCTECDNGFFLNPGSNPFCQEWSAACSAGKTEDQAPSGTQNRVCTQNNCTCDNVNGTAAGGDDCTSNNANICTACYGEFYLNAPNCLPWTTCTGLETETTMPSIVQNRVCTETLCVNVTCDTPPEAGNCYKTAGSCTGGNCAYVAADANTPCNDNNAHTTNDKCDGSSAGVAGCAGTDPNCENVTCAAAAQCRQTGVCAVGTNGNCTYALSAANTACDDGNADTTNDKCSALGVCAGTTAPAPSPAAPSTSSASTLLSVLALAVPVWVAQV